MPLQDLLAQAVAEHEILQSRYDEAMFEISFLRTRLAAVQAPDFAFMSLEEDIEVASSQKHMVRDSFHSAPPEEDEEPTKEGDDRPSKRFTMITPSKDYLRVGGSVSSNSHNIFYSGRQDQVIRFLQNPYVELVLVLIVISNIIVMWLETDRKAAQLPQTLWAEVVDYVYVVIYVCEFALRLFVYRSSVFADRWTRLDFLVIVVDILSMVFKAIFGDGFLGGVNASIFRLLRVFRLMRLFKVLRFIVELQLLIHGFFGAMKAQIFAALMLEVVVLLWSFLFVEVVHPHVLEMSSSGLFDDCSRCLLAYSSMWNAQLTIWQQVIAGDSWGLITLDVIAAHPETTFIFIGCLMTIQFAMLNLIFTVIVDAAARAREEDDQQKLAEKEMSFNTLKEKLIHMCRLLDKDDGGELTLEELIDGYSANKMFADTMATLDITEDDLSTVFMIMDEDRSGSVSYVEFVNNLYKMKEQDQKTLLMFVKGYVVDLRFKLQEIVNSHMKRIQEQTVENADHLQAMMRHVETLVAEGAGNQDEHPASTDAPKRESKALPKMGLSASSSDCAYVADLSSSVQSELRWHIGTMALLLKQQHVANTLFQYDKNESKEDVGGTTDGKSMQYMSLAAQPESMNNRRKDLPAWSESCCAAPPRPLVTGILN